MREGRAVRDGAIGVRGERPTRRDVVLAVSGEHRLELVNGLVAEAHGDPGA